MTRKLPDPFNNRIREATVIPTEETVELLRQATKAASTSLGSADALELVRVAHGREVSAEACERLRARFNAKGQVVEDHHYQLFTTLSAITLIGVFDRPTFVHGLLPALAVRSAGAQRWAPVHPDVFTHAEFYIRERALVMRRPVAADDFKHVPKEGEGPDPMVEIKALRSSLLRDRQLRDESEHLIWWVASRELPRSSTDAAAEFESLLGFVPEPNGAAELFRAKLRDDGDPRPPSRWTFGHDPIPVELRDFCPLLAREPQVAPPDLEQALATLNELFLIRALKDRPIEQ